MAIDNASLLIAIASSSAALMAALLIGWQNSRDEKYLGLGAAGIGLIVISITIMSLRSGAYDFTIQFVPFFLLISGISLIYAGSRQFRIPDGSYRVPAFTWAAAVVMLAIPFVAGYSGIGTIVLNCIGAIYMMLCAWENWRGRQEAPIALVANAVLYTAVASSFVAAAAVLVIDGRAVLDAPPDNWAEHFNLIMSLVGLTGIGAITLTLHHARAAGRHRHEANTDSLTGVLNRRALFAQFPEDSIVPDLVVAMFDLDHFKQINDRRGHAAGDIVLQSFARVLRAETRGADFAARLGGEEFCVVFPGLDREAAYAISERIRAAFAAKAIPTGHENGVATVSVGVASGGDGETFTSLLSRADAALYKAKRDGRNQVQLAALRLVA
ncbi:MAG: GGDEF domain-containing protein [Devosia sp.]|uniref:GGDEF domain-containing protein n=1 Tax=Devosia sp. TaxID=1871048 RepID=UPI0019E586E0|nr:GGDEF domain-containing protein [Devosia sp.]MBF0679783.1 GGDEF domain-containing protein [Devosia sp.]